jgi:hypothetical protein
MTRKDRKSNGKKYGVTTSIVNFAKSITKAIFFPFNAIRTVLDRIDAVMFFPFRIPFRILKAFIGKTTGWLRQRQIFRWLDKLLELPYTIAFFPVRLLHIPTRLFRRIVDKIAGFLYRFWPGEMLSLYANAVSGWLYNVLNGTILLPSLWITSAVFYFFPETKEKYAWMDMCLEGRMYLVMALLYKNITKILLLVPIIGWMLWVVALPLGYFLALWCTWIQICPVESLMPMLSRTSFPKHCAPGCVGRCQTIIP